MSLDGAFLYATKKELEFLIGSRVDKIHQPSREEIVISFRAMGGNHKLLMSSSGSSARVHITNSHIDNPKAPPMFCMLMRKHLGNGKLIDIRQDGLERILFLDFEAMNELGDMVKICVAIEIMGRYSNIIIINGEGKIIDSIKRVTEDMSCQRLILPGMKYQFPPRDDRLNLLNYDENEIRQRLNSYDKTELSKALLKSFEGVAPVLTREWSFYATKGNTVSSDSLTESMWDRLFFIIKDTKNKLDNSECCFTIIKEKTGALKDFSFIRINQFANLMLTTQTNSACETLDYFYTKRDDDARLKQRANDIFKVIVNAIERITKKISVQHEEIRKCDNKNELKLMGDLISSNIYRISKGDSSVEVENFYEENSPIVKIKLDVRLTPSQNAQRYYKEYRKAETAQKKLAEQIEKGEGELAYLDSVFDALSRAKSENDATELRLELAEQGYIKAYKSKYKQPKAQPPLEFRSSDGFTILVGRNNKQNDKLTLKTAEKTDYWFHTHDIAGSHVIIRTNGETPTDTAIMEAANLAGYHSKAHSSAQVPVDYCLVKFVKKPSGAKPGMVIFTNNKTVYVSPNQELADDLRV